MPATLQDLKAKILTIQLPDRQSVLQIVVHPGQERQIAQSLRQAANQLDESVKP